MKIKKIIRSISAPKETSGVLWVSPEGFNYFEEGVWKLVDDATFTDIYNKVANKADKAALPNDISRSSSAATFVHVENGTITNLFYLRQATNSLAGLMSALDKTKLDSLIVYPDISSTPKVIPQKIEESNGNTYDIIEVLVPASTASSVIPREAIIIHAVGIGPLACVPVICSRPGANEEWDFAPQAVGSYLVNNYLIRYYIPVNDTTYTTTTLPPDGPDGPDGPDNPDDTTLPPIVTTLPPNDGTT